MSTYRVVLRADVLVEVEVEANSEAEAEHLAYAEVGDDYEVDFVVESVWPVQ